MSAPDFSPDPLVGMLRGTGRCANVETVKCGRQSAGSRKRRSAESVPVMLNQEVILPIHPDDLYLTRGAFNPQEVDGDVVLGG
jgi:hypothetical protein